MAQRLSADQRASKIMDEFRSTVAQESPGATSVDAFAEHYSGLLQRLIVADITANEAAPAPAKAAEPKATEPRTSAASKQSGKK